jgi:hypothetical protein
VDLSILEDYKEEDDEDKWFHMKKNADGSVDF